MTSLFEKRDPFGFGYALWILVAMVMLTPVALELLGRVELKNDVRNWLPQDDPQAVKLGWFLHHFPSEERILLSWDGSSLEDPRMPLFAVAIAQNSELPEGEALLSGAATPRDAITRIASALEKSYRDYEDDDERIAALRTEVLRRIEGILIGRGTLRLDFNEVGEAERKSLLRTLKQQANSELGIDVEFSDPFDPLAALPDDWDPEQALERLAEPDSSVDEQDAPLDPEIVEEADEPDPELVELVDRIMQLPKRTHDVQIRWPRMLTEPGTIPKFEELARSLRSRPTDQHPEGRPVVDAIFFEPGSPISFVVGLTMAGATNRHETLKKLRDIAESVGIPRETLRMGGQPVAGAELNAEVERVAWNERYPGSQFWKRSPFLVSLVAGILLTFLMLRDLRLSILILVTAVYTMLLSAALVPATGSTMNMILVVMPTLLMVLTISAAIHVANYWKHATITHPDNPRRAVVDAVRMARTPCLLASVTTAIGLASLITSPLVPVREFGIYSALGCLIALLVVLFGFPSMMLYVPGRTPKPESVKETVWEPIGRWLHRHSAGVSIACLFLLAGTAFGLQYFRTETKVIRYFPNDSPIIEDYNFLEENLAGIVPVDVVLVFEPGAKQTKGLLEDEEPRELKILERMEIVRAVAERMREYPEISGTLSIADFQPEVHPPESGLLKMRNYNFRNSKVEAALRGEDSSASSFYAVTDVDSDLSKTGDEVWRITAQVAIMTDLNYGTLTEDLNEMTREIITDYPGVKHVVTGMVPVFLRTQQAVLESLILSFGIAFGIIAVVMMILLRNPLAGVLTMLPNLLPVAVVFGLISWAGLRVDIGTMITASVALGIAVDGTLHLLTWFRDGLRRGLSREDAVALGLSHCGPAMWQTSATVGIGLVMLSFADILLVSRFGWLMGALIGTALIADLIFLPALLSGPLGGLIERGVKTETETDSDAVLTGPVGESAVANTPT